MRFHWFFVVLVGSTCNASPSPDPAALPWQEGSGPKCNECFIGNDCAELTPCYEYCNKICDEEKKKAMEKRDAEK